MSMVGWILCVEQRAMTYDVGVYERREVLLVYMGGAGF